MAQTQNHADRFENVEKLRERANVTYEEARQALDECGGDLLDAMIYLENQGKVNAPSGGGRYSSATGGYQHRESPKGAQYHAQHNNGESFKRAMGSFGNFVKKLLHLGNTNVLEVWRRDDHMVTLPLTVVVLLLIFCFPVVVPLMVVGLFFGFHYRFKGKELEKTGVNKAMDTASETAENIKREFNSPAQPSDNSETPDE